MPNGGLWGGGEWHRFMHDIIEWDIAVDKRHHNSRGFSQKMRWMKIVTDSEKEGLAGILLEDFFFLLLNAYMEEEKESNVFY